MNSPCEAQKCYCGIFVLASHGVETVCVKCGRINMVLGANFYSGEFVYKEVSGEWVTKEDWDKEYAKAYKEWLEKNVRETKT